jgi:ABC-type glycerol-3-phosphate transport system permease component
MIKILKKSLLHIMVLGILAIVLFPIFWMFLNSFKPMNEIFTSTPRIVRTVYTLDNYVRIYALMNFSRYLFNSTVIAFSTSLIALIVAFWAAYAVVRYDFPGKSLYIIFLLILQMIPAVVLIVPLADFVKLFRAYDTYQAVIVLQLGFSTPVCVWLMIGYIKKGCPREFEESAMLDGCTVLQILFKVVLPLAMPGVVTVYLFVFLLSWGDLLIPLTFMGSDLMKTVPLAIASIIEQGPGGSPPWDLLMAISVLYSLPIIIIAFVLQKHVVKGLLSGGVKF